ncbi:MAG: periplasmic divalent cation tolerance protein [Candidatus Omnitrophota bacterium]|jgi:periplasmic divalent cation tolerance protein
MAQFCVAQVACGNTEQAEALAEQLVRQQYAACVNIIPNIKSFYLWEGRLEKSDELLLIIKTRHDLIDDLVAFIQKEHGYDTPEIIILPIQGGSKDYLNWLDKSMDRIPS